MSPEPFVLPFNISLTSPPLPAVLLQDMLGAGTDTPAVVPEWALALLICHPQMMAKAQEEVDRVVGLTNRVKESDLPELPYIQVLETVQTPSLQNLICFLHNTLVD